MFEKIRIITKALILLHLMGVTYTAPCILKMKCSTILAGHVLTMFLLCISLLKYCNAIKSFQIIRKVEASLQRSVREKKRGKNSTSVEALLEE